MSDIDLNISEIINHVLHLSIAFALPLLTAWDREKESRSAGLRTFPLVSMAACGFTLLAVAMFNDVNAQAKVVAGIITGIGFIGGGAILKRNSKVDGTSTAAAIWATGAVGVAVGLGHFEVAITLSLMTFLTLRFVAKVKDDV